MTAPHQGKQAFAAFKSRLPLTYAALGSTRPTTWYAYNNALVWTLPNGIEVTVWAMRVEVGLNGSAQLIVMEPNWKSNTAEFDLVTSHVVGAMVNFQREVIE